MCINKNHSEISQDEVTLTYDEVADVVTILVDPEFAQGDNTLLELTHSQYCELVDIVRLSLSDPALMERSGVDMSKYSDSLAAYFENVGEPISDE